MRVKPCNIRIPSSLSDAQVAADAACAAKRYAYSAEQVESRLNSYVDELTGLDLEQIAANTAAAADVVERAEAAAETAQSSAEVVETLAAEVKEIHDAIIEQDLEQLRQDIETVTDLISTVDGKVSAAQQAAEDAIESASSARQSETAATAALTDTWTAYSAILNEKDNAAAHFATEAEEKVSEAVTAQLNPGGDFYAAVNTAVHDTIPSAVKEEADGYVTQITAEGGSLYNYVEESKADIASAKEEAIESIGEKVDADITAKINPEYISEKVNDVLPGLIDKELADENGAWNTAKNEAIADATEQAELARQWATSETHVADTSYSGAYGYMLMAEGYADQTQSDATKAADSASSASSSASEAWNSKEGAAAAAMEAAVWYTSIYSQAQAAKTAQEDASYSAQQAASSASSALASKEDAATSASNAEASATNAAGSASDASDSAEAAASSESNAAASKNLAERYMEVAEAFAVNDYEGGFIIRDTENGPVVESPSDPTQSYSSARTYAYFARDFANKAHGDAEAANSYMHTAYSWATLEEPFTPSGSQESASARMWAEAESEFYLNGTPHKSAKIYAYSAKEFAESAEATKTSVTEYVEWAAYSAELAASSAEAAASSAVEASQSAATASAASTNASNKASAAATSEENAANSASAASSSAEAARLYSIKASNSAEAAELYSIKASNSAEAAELYSIKASNAASASADSADLSARYTEVAKAFAVGEYDYGFIIRDTDDGPVVEAVYSNYSNEHYSSAKIYAGFAARQAEMAYSWAEAENPFTLNGEEHKSAKVYAYSAKEFAEAAETDEAEALLHAQQASGAAADAATAYEGTLNAYESTLDAYEATKAAVVTAENYLTDVNAVKNAIDQTLISSNWTANNIPVDASGAFSVAIGLVYAVWSKEACEIYKDAALEDKLCTIWAEEQRCILATQATYYVSPVEQAASVIITSVQYTQPSA